MLLEGIFLPLTTPFHPDGRVYLRKLESNVGRYSLTPSAGMLVLGRAGEGTCLSDEETEAVLRSAIDAAADSKVMLAGVGRESVLETLRFTGIAADAGYDAVAIEGPEFSGDPAMRLETMTYFQAVADGSPLPVVVLSDSARPVGGDVVAELAGHPQVIGVMDAQATGESVAWLKEKTASVSREVTVTNVFAAVTGRMLRKVETSSLLSVTSLGSGASVAAATAPTAGLKTRKKRVGFQMLTGGTDRMLEAWEAGASGAIPRLSACAPQGCCEVWQAFKDGDLALAQEKQARVNEIGVLTERIAALKYGCDVNGYFGGRPRLPLMPLNREQQRLIEAGLAGLRT